MRNYTLKIVLRGVSPIVLRRFVVPGDLSLAEFHDVLQLSFGWDDDHLHLFHIHGKDFGVYCEGGMNFDDDARSVWIDDFGFESRNKFYYTYNFHENLIHDIRVEAVDIGFVPRPQCTGGRGLAVKPEHDEIDLLNWWVEYAPKLDTVTVGEIRWFAEAYQALRFRRRPLNQALAEQFS